MSGEQIRSEVLNFDGDDQRLHMVWEDLQILRHETTDDMSARFYTELSQAIAQRESIRSLVNEVISAQPKQDPRYINEFMLRGMSAIELEYDTSYPAGRDTLGSWTVTFDRLEDELIREKFLLNSYRNIQSNVAQRAAVFQAVLAIYGITEGVRLLEYGCSDLQIGKMLASRLDPNLAYNEISVHERRRLGAVNKIIKNPYLSHQLNNLIEAPFTVEHVGGLDLWNPDDPAVSAWIRVCSSYLSELSDRDRQRQFEKLHNLHLPNIEFRFHDFTTYSSEQYDLDFPGRSRPHAVVISFAAYQLTRSERQQTLRQASQMMDENEHQSLVLVLDDIQSISRTYEPHIARRKRDYSTTGLWVYDNKNAEAGYQKFMSIRTGRCQELMYEPAMGNLAIQSALR